MSWELSPAVRQDLSDALAQSPLTHAKLSDALERFGMEQPPTGESVALWARIRAILREYQGEDSCLNFLDHVIRIAAGHGTADEAIKNALTGSPFEVTRIDGTTHLVLRSEEAVASLEKAEKSFVEAHATAATTAHLEQAQIKLGQGDPSGALIEARKALEAMSFGDFSLGLDELISLGLIAEGSSKPKKRVRDADFLRSLYGYLSTLGSHTTGSGPPTSLVQGRLGVMTTASGVAFLLHVIVDARNGGTTLARWN